MERNAAYPASLMIDHAERSDRVTAFFRLVLVIPAAILLALLTGPWARHDDGRNLFLYAVASGPVLVPTLLMILFRRKYPRWWFDWNLSFTRFAARVTAYVLLLRDEYPSTDEEQAVHLAVPYPEAATELRRGMPLVKWFLALPHVLILGLLWTLALIVTPIAWLAILFTGSYPRELFDLVVGVMRWTLRMQAYALLLTTDRYPPFRLGE